MVERLKEILKALKKSSSSPQDRAKCYASLTNLVKEHTSSNPEFVALLCQHHVELTEKMLSDITCKSCDHASLQVLGYCLHNPDFAAKFTDQQVSRILEGLRGIIMDENTDKAMCTRALWCLANQSIVSSQLISHVTSLVTVVSKVMLSQRCATPTVESEGLNFYTRFSQQFPAEFTAVAPVWYKTLVHILFCKVHKLQRRALFLAVSHEYTLRGDQEIVQWLCKELKDHLVEWMMSQMRERGQDYVHILNTWSHFISILGKALHKHGSFLNELLPVVETGFKHKSFVVQVAAYTAWKSLVSNFSLQLDLMTTPKRLKLLLMPLVASAVRDRHEHVEQARIQAWWHLIGCLGNQKEALFNQVCVPFLMLCLGLDPKSDISQLSAQISHLYSSNPDSTPLSRNESVTTPISHSHTLKLAVTPTPSSNVKSNTSTPNVSQNKSLSASGRRGHFRIGSLVTLLNSPRTPRPFQDEGKKKSREHYLKPPTVSMVITGCHALLQFTGGRDEMEHSLIETDPKQYLVYPKFIVPLDIAQFLVLFLDGLTSFLSSHSDRDKLKKSNLVVHHILSLIVSTVKAEDAPSNSGDHPLISNILTSVLKMLDSGVFDEYLVTQARRDILSQLCALSPQCVAAAEHNTWKCLVHVLLRCPKNEQMSEWFYENWQKILSIASSRFMTPDPLSNLLYLSDVLEEFVQSTEVERNCILKMWCTLAKWFISRVTETSQINNGTALEPDFKLVSQILKFPFYHILDQLDRNRVTTVMETWKSVYETSNRHIPLVVKDPNTCARVVCADLYTAYGSHLKSDPSTLDRRPNMIKFDLYQNAMATAVKYITSKLNWSHCGKTEVQNSHKDRHGNTNGKDKSIQTLLSLMAWELATFWDSTQKSPVSLSQMNTPYTLMDTMETLFTHLPTSDLIKQATNMLAQPLATLWDSIISTCDGASLSTRTRATRTSSVLDLQDKVMSSWKSIMTCYQSRYKKPYHSDILADISPLMIVTLSSPKVDFMKSALSFWTLTFDLSPHHLVYPPKLRDFFTKYLKETKSPLPLKLPGFNEPELVNRDALKMSVSSSSVPPSIRGSESMYVQSQPPAVLLPNVSPHKRVLVSFLNRPPAVSPIKLPSAPSSPGAKALNEVLTRSAKEEAKNTATVSPGKVGVVSTKKGVGQSPALSVRRKLSLSEDEATYVAVAPPPKKPHLLTEHQKEKRRERSVLPTMYNALDPSSLETQQQYTVEDSMPEDDAPIIIPESDVSPATPISRPLSQQSKQPSHYCPTSFAPFSETTPTTVNTSGTAKQHQSVKQHKQIQASTYQQPITIDDSPQNTPSPESSHAHSINILRKRRKSNEESARSTMAPCAPPKLISDVASSSKLNWVTMVTSRSAVQAKVTRGQSSDKSAQPLSPTEVAFSIGQPSSGNTTTLSNVYNKAARNLGVPPKQMDASITAMILSQQISNLQKQVASQVAIGTPAPPTVQTVSSQTGGMQRQARVSQPFSSANLDTSRHPPRVANTNVFQFQTSQLPATNVIHAHRQSAIMVARPLPTGLPVSQIQQQLSVSSGTRPNPGQVTLSYTIPSSATQQVQLSTNLQPKHLPATAAVTQPHPQTVSSTICGPPTDHHHQPSCTNTQQTLPVVKKARLSLKQSASDVVHTQKSIVSKGLNVEPSVQSKGLKDDDHNGPAIGEDKTKESVCSDASEEMTATIVDLGSKKRSDNCKQHVKATKKERKESKRQETSSGTKSAMDVIIIEADGMETDGGQYEGERGNRDRLRKRGVFESEDPLVGLSSKKQNKSAVESENKRPHFGGIGDETMEDDSTVTETPIKKTDEMKKLRHEPSHREESQVCTNQSSEQTKVSRKEKEVSLSSCVSQKVASTESTTITVHATGSVDGPIPKSNSHVTTAASDGESVTKRDHGNKALVDQSKSVAMTTDSVESKSADSTNVVTSPVANDNQEPAEKATPIGILKHVSQFDTPATGRGGRRVQFASNPIIHSREEGDSFKTPRHGTSRVARTPQSAFSSRRTLLLSQTPPKMILVNKPHPQTPPIQEAGPIYPNLMDCSLPVGQILPALSASKFTHGLLQLVKARNISTVGDISCLSEQQVQTLPIKSPKVESLRDALRSVEKQQQGLKRKCSVDETGFAPPKKQLKLTSDSTTAANTSEAPPTTSNDHTHKTAPVLDANTCKDSEVFSEVMSTNESCMNDITLATPDSQNAPDESDKLVNKEVEPLQEDHTHSSEPSTDREKTMDVSSSVQLHTDASKTTTVVATVSHDHSYCSQDLAGEDSLETTTMNELSVAMGNNTCVTSKLSFANNDHTYCNPVKARDVQMDKNKVGVASEEGVAIKENGRSSVAADMVSNVAEQAMEKSSPEDTTPQPEIVNSERSEADVCNDGDTEYEGVCVESVSQELFSFDQSQNESHDKSPDQSCDHPQEEHTSTNDDTTGKLVIEPHPSQPMEVTTPSNDTSDSENPSHMAECSQLPPAQEEGEGITELSALSTNRHSDQLDEREATREGSKSEGFEEDLYGSLERWLSKCEEEFDGMEVTSQFKMLEDVQRACHKLQQTCLRAQQIMLDFTQRMGSKFTEDSRST